MGLHNSIQKKKKKLSKQFLSIVSLPRWCYYVGPYVLGLKKKLLTSVFKVLCITKKSQKCVDINDMSLFLTSDTQSCFFKLTSFSWTYIDYWNCKLRSSRSSLVASCRGFCDIFGHKFCLVKETLLFVQHLYWREKRFFYIVRNIRIGIGSNIVPENQYFCSLCIVFF